MDSKICSYCKIQKPISDFNFNYERKMPYSQCKKCKSLIYKERRRNRMHLNLCVQCGKQSDYYYCEKCNLKMTQRHKKNRENTKHRAVNYLGGFCKSCGKKYVEICVYDFHHDKGKKENTLAFLFAAKVEWEIIQKELDKCVLLCGNCHRIFHNKNGWKCKSVG